MALTEDRAVFLEANGLNKTLKQAIIDGDLSGGGGSSSFEVFNAIISVGDTAPVNGVSFYLPSVGKTINFVRLMAWDLLGVSSGSLEVDIKKNSTPDDVGMATIFTTKPIIDFSTASNYATDGGTLSSGAYTGSEVLRLDVTNIPAGWNGKFSVVVFAQ